jgi:hypothetical protein
LALFWLAGCQAPVVPPARHAKVPADAVWSGGADGGAWIACAGPIARAYDCKVFHDLTGELEISGRFAYMGPGSPPDARSLDLNGFDGTTIFLKKGRSLVPR